MRAVPAPPTHPPRSLWLLALVLVALGGCLDRDLPTAAAPEGAVAAISDAVHGSKVDGFYFLPPMVPQPNYDGDFDAALSPMVKVVCTGASGPNCSQLIKTFTMGTGSEALTVDLAEQAYRAQWHTKNNSSGLELGPDRYRLEVWVGDVMLGFADLWFVEKNNQLKDVLPGYVGATTGKPLAIKFRIETGIPGSVVVEPASATIGLGETQQFTATLYDLHGALLTNTTPEWTISGEDVATVDASGLASGVGLGQTTITASAGPASGSATLSVEIEPMVSAGGGHTCAVTRHGDAYCWGGNQSGQLGNGSSSPPLSNLVPVPVAGSHKFVMLSAGATYTCGIRVDGQTLCWGRGGPHLGTTSAPDTCTNFPSFPVQEFACATTPVPVQTRLRFSSVSTASGSGRHTCATTAAGSAYCWGSNESGQLGNGSTPDSWMPVPVAGGYTFAEVSAGENHSCGVTTSGTAYCWGRNADLQLGVSTAPETCPLMPTLDKSCSRSPIPVSDGRTFVTVSAARVFTCALTPRGAAFCWGANHGGFLGNGSQVESATPVQVAGGHRFAQLEGRVEHTCAISVVGLAYCWGWNREGSLGVPVDTELCPISPDSFIRCSTTPVQVSGGLTFRQVSTGRGHSCGVRPDRTLFCWGGGILGQLGHGSMSGSETPVPVSGWSSLVARVHALAKRFAAVPVAARRAGEWSSRDPVG